MKQLITTTLILLFAVVSFAQSSTEIAVNEAQENYNAIVKSLQENKVQRVQLENELEKNRMALRNAKRALKEEQKAQNPTPQEPYEVLQNALYEHMSQGMQTGFSVYMPNGEADGLGNLLSRNVDGEFKAYMKNYSVGKVKKTKGELFFDNIVIPEVSSMPLDAYVDIVKEDQGVTLKAFFTDGAKFMDFTEDNNATANAKNILVHFAKAIHKKNLEAELNKEEKDLEKAFKDLENAHKSVANAREDIGKAEGEVVASQSEILETENKIDALTDKIEQKRIQIKNVVLD